MFNLSKYFNNGAGLKYFCLVIIIISSTFFLSKISIADEDRALVAPMSVLGKVSVPEQQILFNRLREKLNQHFHIVSHKVLALIAEKGLKSIDIEDCTSSKCVKKVLSFIRNLELQFKTDKMFMFQLVRRENVTQMSLKYAEMSVPEITRKIVTRTCRECGTEKLIQNVDILVQRMFQKLMLKNIALPEKEISLSKKEIALPLKKKLHYRLRYQKRKLPVLKETLLRGKKRLHLHLKQQRLPILLKSKFQNYLYLIRTYRLVTHTISISANYYST